MNSEPDNAYPFKEQPELLSALLRNARVSLGEMAEQLDTYRQKLWRNLQDLQDETIWGYTIALDPNAIGWRKYMVQFEIQEARADDVHRFSQLLIDTTSGNHIHLLDAFVLSGKGPNVSLQMLCETPVHVESFVRKLQNYMEHSLRGDVVVREVVYASHGGGFTNPNTRGELGNTLVEKLANFGLLRSL